MKKIIFLIALLLCGTMVLGSCSDDGISDEERAAQEAAARAQAYDPYGKYTEEGLAVYTVLSYCAEIDSLPNDWKTFTVEPTVGYVLNEAQAYVRTIPVGDLAAARNVFCAMTGKFLEDGQTSATLTNSYYTITYTEKNQSDLYAVIDIEMVQMPHLVQLRLVPESALDMNKSAYSWKAGELPFYYTGDVVKDKDGSYWICVRSAWNNTVTSSYWVSLNLVEKKNITKRMGKDKVIHRVPINLESHSADFHNNFAQLMYYITYPDKYVDKKSNLGGLGEAYTKEMVQQISEAWKADIWSDGEKKNKSLFELINIPPDVFTADTLCIFHTGHKHEKEDANWLGYGGTYYVTLYYETYQEPGFIDATPKQHTFKFETEGGGDDPYYFDVSKLATTYGRTATNIPGFVERAVVLRHPSQAEQSDPTKSIYGYTPIYRYREYANSTEIKVTKIVNSTFKGWNEGDQIYAMVENPTTNEKVVRKLSAQEGTIEDNGATATFKPDKKLGFATDKKTKWTIFYAPNAQFNDAQQTLTLVFDGQDGTAETAQAYTYSYVTETGQAPKVNLSVNAKVLSRVAKIKLPSDVESLEINTSGSIVVSASNGMTMPTQTTDEVSTVTLASAGADVAYVALPAIDYSAPNTASSMSHTGIIVTVFKKGMAESTGTHVSANLSTSDPDEIDMSDYQYVDRPQSSACVSIGGYSWSPIDLYAKNKPSKASEVYGTAYTLTQTSPDLYNASMPKMEDLGGGYYDPARVCWGYGWRLPNKTMIEKLATAKITEGSHDFEKQKAACFIYTDKDNSSNILYLPKASNNSFWSSTRSTDDTNKYYTFVAGGKDVKQSAVSDKCRVRPVYSAE